MKFAKEEIEKAIAYSVKKIDYEELRQELRKLHVREVDRSAEKALDLQYVSLPPELSINSSTVLLSVKHHRLTVDVSAANRLHHAGKLCIRYS